MESIRHNQEQNWSKAAEDIITEEDDDNQTELSESIKLKLSGNLVFNDSEEKFSKRYNKKMTDPFSIENAE